MVFYNVTLIKESYKLFDLHICYGLYKFAGFKSKRGEANLLAGRAFKSELFPLTWFELAKNKKFKLNRYLRFGGLPLAYLKKNCGRASFSNNL